MQRNTSQRQAIREAFAGAGRPLSVPEALAVAKKRVPGLGTATVYRAVNAMVEEGYLKAVEIPGEAARYEPADMEHHHHFQCRSCNKVFDVEGCPGRIGDMAPEGFELESHEIILYGRCPQCAEA